MKESVGYTVTLNIIIVFITIVIMFICAALIYFKSNKASNVITTAIEKYEGYNDIAIDEINLNLSSLGYGGRDISSSCASEIKVDKNIAVVEDGKCYLVSNSSGRGTNGYCVYLCDEKDSDYYFYKIRTNMAIDIPIINNLLNIPIYSDSVRLYDFESVLGS